MTVRLARQSAKSIARIKLSSKHTQ